MLRLARSRYMTQDKPVHRIRVVKLAPQQFVVRCTCGAELVAPRAKTPYWSKGNALDGVFRHQRACGLPESIAGVDYVEAGTGSRYS